MRESCLPCVELQNDPAPDAAIVWLHGLGADGHDFEPIVPDLDLPPELKVRFVFPHAPAQPVTWNGGYIMPAWYDIYAADLAARIDSEGIERSARRIDHLIEREIMRGIKPERIVLAGFSQGGAMALHVGLRQEQPLAGILALSCYLLPMASAWSEASRATPLFIAHGINDPVVPLFLGDAAQRQIAAQGYEVQWHTYPMPHSVCMQEIRAIGRWLTERLG